MDSNWNIDVVIPTLNCAKALRECLDRLARQDYRWEIRTFVVDGGSIDATLEVAKEFGCNISVNPGQYPTGLSGSRIAGERKGKAPLVWCLDSDNLVVEQSVATSLVQPFIADQSMMITFPQIEPCSTYGSFNRWLSLVEETNLTELGCAGEPAGKWITIPDLYYGLPNAAIVRRSGLERALGYDADWRLLSRLRALGLSRAAFVPGAHYIHLQARGPRDFVRKWTRRIRRFDQVNVRSGEAYYAPATPNEILYIPRGGLPGQPIDILARYPAQGLAGWLRTRDRSWLWGLAYPVIMSAALLPNVRAALRVWNTLGRRVSLPR